MVAVRPTEPTMTTSLQTFVVGARLLVSIALAACAAFGGGSLAAQDSEQAAPTVETLRDAVARTVVWLEAQAVPLGEEAGDGVAFPSVAEQPAERSAVVYGGAAGVLVFLENAAAILDDARAAALADRAYAGLRGGSRGEGNDRTWAPAEWDAGGSGLYTGDAGIGQAFLVRARLRDDHEALAAAVEVGDLLLARSLVEGEGAERVRWWDEQFEVIFGASGTVLFFLDLAEASDRPRFRDAALEVARAIIDAGEAVDADPPQRFWRWQFAGNQPYVGFSHGTAGVSYALLRVGRACDDQACVDAALEGANWLAALALREEKLIRWPVIAGRKDSMGGWCHGAPGTARLHLLLHEHTGEARFLATAEAASHWVMAQAGPEDAKVPPAFPPTFCCGVAGALDYFCDLYRATGNDEYLSFARRAGAHLLATADEADGGLSWASGQNAHGVGAARHGVDLMLGAAGEGLALLRLATIGQSPDPVYALPDRTIR